jgi:tetratricopeptide (TPR) repeat protein
MLPLIVLSERAFAAPREKTSGLVHLAANFVLAGCVAAALGQTWLDLPGEWRELANGRSEMAHEAIAWMKTHGIQGKLFHRCEDGGLLQMEGFTQTFSDTGFGKFDEAFIHETGLVNERPARLPKWLTAYQPDFVVCSNFCYQWPYYLKQAGWRLIFYSPNSSVWTRPETRPDLPTVTDDEIKAAFDQDLKANGVPTEIAMFGRNLVALNSLGLGDFAYAKMNADVGKSQFLPWYWETARLMCFGEPPTSPHKKDFMKMSEDVYTPGECEFYALGLYEEGDWEEAASKLPEIPEELTNTSAELMLRIELAQNDPEVFTKYLPKFPKALPLARRTDCWDLRNGRHWMYLAEAEERWGSLDAARSAWKKAVFYYPDDDELMKAAADFAAKHNDAELKQEIADSAKVYGAP